MALASPSSTETLHLKLEKSDAEIPLTTSIIPPSLQTSTANLSSSSAPSLADSFEIPNPNPNPNPNSNPGAVITPLAPPAVPSFTPSYRLVVHPSAPQYTAVPNQSIHPPGVSAPIVSVNPMMQASVYQALAYGSNGYLSVPSPGPHAIPPPVDHV